MIISYSAELLSHLRSSVKAYLERVAEPETLLSSFSLSSFPFSNTSCSFCHHNESNTAVMWKSQIVWSSTAGRIRAINTLQQTGTRIYDKGWYLEVRCCAQGQERVRHLSAAALCCMFLVIQTWFGIHSLSHVPSVRLIWCVPLSQDTQMHIQAWK